jgi:hypothetical protein
MNTPIIDENIRLDKEIYVVAETSDGSIKGKGTQSNPYRLNDLDILVPLLGNSIKINLLPGIYFTNGFRVPPWFIILGSNRKDVIIRLKSDIKQKNFNYPHIRMFADRMWSELFIAKNLTLDGNWNEQYADNHGNFKVELISVQTILGKAENIDVINFGCSARDYGKRGLEAFPLTFQTFSNGKPFNYSPEFRSMIGGNESQTYIEIVNCTVSRPHFFDGGFCTAIFARTNFPTDGDRQPFGSRETLAASIRNNYCNVPGGGAYGCAISEMIEFVGNIAEDCQAGYNTDTGQCSRIKILNNQFRRCSSGIHFFPYPGSTKVDISGNIIILKEPFYNKVLGRLDDSFGIWTGNVSNLNINRNYINFNPITASSFLGDTGYTDNNVIVPEKSNNSNTDDCKKIKQENESLTTELNNTKTNYNNLQREYASEKERLNNQLKAEIDKSNRNSEYYKTTISNIKSKILNHKNTVMSLPDYNGELWKGVESL